MRLFLRIEAGQEATRAMNYPQKPGFKARETAKAAAKSVEPKAKNLRERVYDAIKRAGRAGATADEVAEMLSASILSVRPRVSELVLMGALDDTFQRRANKGSGRHAIVWRAR